MHNINASRFGILNKMKAARRRRRSKAKKNRAAAACENAKRRAKASMISKTNEVAITGVLGNSRTSLKIGELCLAKCLKQVIHDGEEIGEYQRRMSNFAQWKVTPYQKTNSIMAA